MTQPNSESETHNLDLSHVAKEPYPELRSVLRELVSSVSSALGTNFVGAYLVGSLAAGDFDLDSDVDFLIVTEDELDDSVIPVLNALHARIHERECYPARHLEGSYVSKRILRKADLVGVQSLWYVDNGSRTLDHSVHDNQWHVRWILRERGITLIGPDPTSLVPPIPAEALREEVLAVLRQLESLMVAEMDAPLAWFNTRFGQPFAVLTGCRVMHTLETGTVQSKRAAVNWAERGIDRGWLGLIQQAWEERKGVRFGVKISQRADLRDRRPFNMSLYSSSCIITEA